MMDFGKTTRYVAAVILSCVLFACISYVQTQMNTIIEDNRLTDTSVVENAPPIIAFTTIALGSFRGLLADMLWVRSNMLQESGNYYEMVQLASWITKLQPRFTGGTCFLAWNMAYNISVTCSSFADRWRWVQRGIELIRDEALIYNPEDPILYKELGWIYQHKVGNIMDDANLYYKFHMAQDLMKAFGGTRIDWRKLVDTPKTIAEFERLHADDKALNDALSQTGYSNLNKLFTKFKEEGELPKELSEKLDKKMAEALDLMFRNVWLRQKYRLYADEVVKINEKYGELDWRLPETQAIYWATLGIKHSREDANIDCERMITQSLHDAFRRGRLLLFPKEEMQRPITVPNLAVVDAVRQTYLDTQERHKRTKTFRSAMTNFMIDAIVTLYTYGNYDKAKEYLTLLRKEHPGNPKYLVPLQEFIIKERIDDVKNGTRDQVQGLVNGLIYQSNDFILHGDYEAANAQLKMARLIYAVYKEEQKTTQKRMGLENMEKLKEALSSRYEQGLPPNLRKVFKARIAEINSKVDEAEKK